MDYQGILNGENIVKGKKIKKIIAAVLANMQAICDKYEPSVKAYLLIPLIGSLFADFINSLTITFFINFL